MFRAFQRNLKKKNKKGKQLTKKIIFKDGLACEMLKDNECLITDEKSKKKISIIKFKNEVESIIELDNKDILFQEKTLKIYRLKNDKYYLFQEIVH